MIFLFSVCGWLVGLITGFLSLFSSCSCFLVLDSRFLDRRAVMLLSRIEAAERECQRASLRDWQCKKCVI